MGAQVDPFYDVLFVRNLAHDELISEVLMVDDKSRVANDVLDLLYATKHRPLWAIKLDLNVNIEKVTYNSFTTENPLAQLEEASRLHSAHKLVLWGWSLAGIAVFEATGRPAGLACIATNEACVHSIFFY